MRLDWIFPNFFPSAIFFSFVFVYLLVFTSIIFYEGKFSIKIGHCSDQFEVKEGQLAVQGDVAPLTTKVLNQNKKKVVKKKSPDTLTFPK